MSIMPKCPRCGARVELRRLALGDTRQLECNGCPAVLVIPPRAMLLPAMLPILLGPPAAKAVEQGWIGVAPAVAGGLLLFFAAAVLGYALSPPKVVGLRGQDPSGP